MFLQSKIRHFNKVDAGRYAQLWRLQQAEVLGLVRRLLAADRRGPFCIGGTHSTRRNGTFHLHACHAECIHAGVAAGLFMSNNWAGVGKALMRACLHHRIVRFKHSRSRHHCRPHHHAAEALEQPHARRSQPPPPPPPRGMVLVSQSVHPCVQCRAAVTQTCVPQGLKPDHASAFRIRR